MSFVNHFRVRIIIDKQFYIHDNKQIIGNQKELGYNMFLHHQGLPFFINSNFNKVVGKEKPITSQPIFHEQGIILESLKNKN
jgi:hypothetical protein